MCVKTPDPSNKLDVHSTCPTSRRSLWSLGTGRYLSRILSNRKAFVSLLQQPVPKDDEPDSMEEREKWLPWKIKKWITSIFDRLFQRYEKVYNLLIF